MRKFLQLAQPVQLKRTGHLSYLAIAATRAGRAFGLRPQLASDRIAARIELVALFDRSAVALFPVVDYPVTARSPDLQLCSKQIESITRRLTESPSSGCSTRSNLRSGRQLERFFVNFFLKLIYLVRPVKEAIGVAGLQVFYIFRFTTF